MIFVYTVQQYACVLIACMYTSVFSQLFLYNLCVDRIHIQVRVLHKEPRGRDVDDGDRFLFNKDFTAKLHRIRINTIQLKETTEENEKTHEAVFRERQYQVRKQTKKTEEKEHRCVEFISPSVRN